MEHNWKPWRLQNLHNSKVKPLPTELPNINNHMCCQMVPINKNLLPRHLQLYDFRFNTCHPIFRIHHFSCQTMPSISLPSDTILGKIVFEQPLKRLSEMEKPINIENSLYIAKTVLMGCEKLVEYFGWFRVQETMIGFVQYGECKLWVHDQLEINQVMLPANSEQEMVESIKQILIKILPLGEMESIFIERLRNQRHTAIQLVKMIWLFSYQFSILIPPFFSNSDKLHRKTRSQIPLNFPKRQSTDCTVSSKQQSKKRMLELKTARYYNYNYNTTNNNTNTTNNTTNTTRRNSTQGQNINMICQEKKNVSNKKNLSNLCCRVTTLPSGVRSLRDNSRVLINVRTQENKENRRQDDVNLYLDLHCKRDGDKMDSLFSERNRRSLGSNYTYQQTQTKRTNNLRQATTYHQQKMNKSNLQQITTPHISLPPQKKPNSKSDLISPPTPKQAPPQTQIQNQQGTNSSYQQKQKTIPQIPQHTTTTTPTSISSLIQTDWILSESLYHQQHHNDNHHHHHQHSQHSSLIEENKIKMKNMIKEKIRNNREKKKVVELQSIQTVKSIGEFTHSQRKIEQSSVYDIRNQHVQVLQKMCKIGISYLKIEGPCDEDGEESTDGEKRRIRMEKSHVFGLQDKIQSNLEEEEDCQAPIL